MVDTVVRQCGEHASPQTRWNGLSALRKILKTLSFGCDNTFQYEVQEPLQWETFLEDRMLKILASMSRQEKTAIRRDERSGALWLKLVEVEQLRQDYCIMEKMKQILKELDQVDTDQEVSEGEGDDHDSQGTD